MNALDAYRFNPREGGASFPFRHRLFRLVWGAAWLILGRFSPVPMHGWRRFLLRIFGAKIDRSAKIYPSAKIWYPPNLEMAEYSCIASGVTCYCMDLVSLGPYALVSQGAHLCGGTHDVDDPNFQLVSKPIRLERNSWIAAEAFVGPGVTIGAGAVLGARGLAFRDLEPHTIYAGNPARPLRRRIGAT